MAKQTAHFFSASDEAMTVYKYNRAPAKNVQKQNF